jgi:hypothetical protein
VNFSSKVLSNLLFGTTYYWRAAITNTNDTSAYSATWSFTTLDMVNNTSPLNGAVNRSTTTTIDWLSMTGNNGYIYEVDTSPNFNSSLYESGSTGVNFSSKVLSNLLFGTTYYWRAAITNTNDTSAYGATWSFTTEYQLVSAPSLLSPIDASLSIPTTSTQLVWDSISNVSSYQVMYSTSSNFTSVVSSTTTAQLNTTITNLNGNTTYYWRVRGSNNAGYSPWSMVWSFTTETIMTNIATIESNGMTLYPNPVQGLLEVSLGTKANYQMRVINIGGQIVDEYQFNDSKTTYNTSHLIGGIYFLEVRTDKAIRRLKFIKN